MLLGYQHSQLLKEPVEPRMVTDKRRTRVFLQFKKGIMDEGGKRGNDDGNETIKKLK